MRHFFLALFFSASAWCSEGLIEVVLYSNASCIPCRETKRILNELKIKWIEGQGDKEAGIEFYPTIVILVGGVEKSRIVGGKTKEELVKLLER